MAFTVSATMRKMIEDWEGQVLVAGPDVVGVPTVGYGHTGPDVYNGQTITVGQADALLAADLHHFEVAVSGMAQNLNQQRFDALVSFSFNLGEGALHGSTLLRKHNAGDFAGAADEFLKWNHAGGQVYAGLTRRRQGERQMYLSGGTDMTAQAPASAGTQPQPLTPSAPDLKTQLWELYMTMKDDVIGGIEDAIESVLNPAPAAPEDVMPDLKDLQAALGITADGIWGPNTAAAVAKHYSGC